MTDNKCLNGKGSCASTLPALLMGIVSLLTSAMPFAQTAGSDIWLGKFSEAVSSENIDPESIEWRQVTDAPTYHNQPYFHLPSQSLFYTGMVGEQTDYFRYDLQSGEPQNLTNSTQSEYSPTVTPDQQGLSGIIVDDQGKQWLWQWTLNGKSVGKLLPTEPIGYHVWLNKQELLVFVLGKQQQPIHTLQRQSISSEHNNNKVIDKYVGASLWPIPNTNAFSYSRMKDNKHQLMRYNPDLSTSSYMADLPINSAYYAWAPDGYVVTADAGDDPLKANTLTAWSANNQTWQRYLDMSQRCTAGISRLAFSDDYQFIAVVCNRG